MIDIKEKICVSCGEKFTKKTTLNQTEWKNKRACSRKCFNDDRRELPIDRINRHTKVNPVTECIEWQASKFNGGYGKIKIDGKNRYAHRVMWEIYNGPIPEGIFVCHCCDNPGCVHPNHLFLGTAQDNMDDKTRKGRGMHGEKHTSARLTEAKVREIRASDKGHTELAGEYGITMQSIMAVRNGKTWKHVA